MNPQPQMKKRSINKLIPTGGNINTSKIPSQKNPYSNIAIGTPIQSKRPFNAEKSPSNLNQSQGNFSARGSKNNNLKVSSSNFGMRNIDHAKSSLLETNNTIRINSAGKKLDFQRKSVDLNSNNNTAHKKNNSSMSNLYGVIKGKIIFFQSCFIFYEK